MTQKILHVIGTGPGAPDLLPVRSVKILREAKLIFAAASSTRDFSACLNIAGPWLGPDVRKIRLDFPMTKDAHKLREAWSLAAKTCLAEMKDYASAVFLTLGDPLLYSTFIYLCRELVKQNKNLAVNIVPGIASFQAAAAKCHFPLCEGKESLRIISGTGKEEELAQALASQDNIVILKVYRNFRLIRELLRETGRLENALLVTQVENREERIIARLKEISETPHYMSLILSHKEKLKES